MNSIQNNAIIEQRISFKGFDKSFSIDKVKFSDVADAIKENKTEIDSCKYVDLAIANGEDVCIKAKAPFSLTNGILNEGENIFINAQTSHGIKTNGNGSLLVPVGVGERYNEVQQYLKLNFANEDIAKYAKGKFLTSSGFHYDKMIVNLAKFMNMTKQAEDFLLLNLRRVAKQKI